MQCFCIYSLNFFIYIFIKMNILLFFICQKMSTMPAQQQPNLDLPNGKVEFFQFEVQQKYQEELEYL